MKKAFISSIAVAILAMAILVSCGGEEAPKGDTSWKEKGTTPVAITNVHKPIMEVLPSFEVTIQNVISSPVVSVKWMAVFFDEAGNVIGTEENGYAPELEVMEPGQSDQVIFTTSFDKAVTAKIVVSEVLYNEPNPVDKLYGELMMKWKNPKLDEEIAKLKQK